MSDTITRPHTSHEYIVPNMGNFGEPDLTNPAVAARAEFEQREYTDYMAAPDPESRAVESGIPLTPIREGGAVNALESVPAAEELHVYSDNAGNAIDPQHAEAALQEVKDLYTPEREPVHDNAKANQLAQMYGPYVENVRDYYTIKWGGESLN